MFNCVQLYYHVNLMFCLLQCVSRFIGFFFGSLDLFQRYGYHIDALVKELDNLTNTRIFGRNFGTVWGQVTKVAAGTPSSCAEGLQLSCFFRESQNVGVENLRRCRGVHRSSSSDPCSVPSRVPGAEFQNFKQPLNSKTETLNSL